MSNTNIAVPNDMAIEIFLLITAKPLLRLRWACKYWFDLITRDDDFIKKHYLLHHHTTATNTHDDDNDDRILSNTSFWISNSKTVVYTMNFGDVVNIDHDDDGTSRVNMDCYNLPFYNLDRDDHLEFYGSCNGLVLFFLHSRPFSNNDTYFLWNPCTREVRELPHEPFNTYTVNKSYKYIVLGFGYDHTIDDYKVMRIIFYSQFLNDNASICHLEIDIGVYTLGSNSWSTKIVTDPLLVAHLNKQIQNLGVLVNGALHWTDEWEGIGTITSFDITMEELREMQGPNEEELIEMERSITFADDEPQFRLILSVLNGCLCMCQMPHFKQNYVIWMMKDYGVKDSWTRLFTIDMEKVLAAPARYGMLRYFREPFEQFYKDGGILMVFNKNKRDMIIVACDSKKNGEARFIYSIDRDHKYEFVNGTYTESLVSLNSGMYLPLSVGSRTPTFQKQDLLEYDVEEEEDSRYQYLVRKGTKKQDT